MDIDLRTSSELEAVNLMLFAIGETSVNSLNNPGVIDAVNARQLLTATSRRVQAKGWQWNTDLAIQLPLTFPEKEVLVPKSTLKIDTSGASEGLDVVWRGKRLYDRRAHSYSFDQPVTVDITYMLGWDDLTETARQYILIAAGRQFQEGAVGSPLLEQFSERAEILALVDLMNEEGENADLNFIAGLRGLDR